jgi:hypothetical protein
MNVPPSGFDDAKGSRPTKASYGNLSQEACLLKLASYSPRAFGVSTHAKG